MKKHLIKLSILFFILSLYKIGNTSAYFTNTQTVTGLTISTGYWITPTTKIGNSEPAFNKKDIIINYILENGESLDHVQLCYAFNLARPLICPNDDKFKSTSGSFDFNAEKDGIYEFYTQAFDKNGNREDKPETTENIYKTLIDTQAPSTSISLGRFGQDWHANNNLIINGGFETDPDLLKNWAPTGKGEHKIINNDDVRTGNIALIGWQSTTPTTDGTDEISQSISIGATETNLSFWYRIVSDDIGDNDWLSVKVIDSTNETVLLKAAKEITSIENDLGWKQANYSLAPWANKNVTIKFELVNHNSLKTYALLDDVRVTNSPNYIYSISPISFNAYDSTSGIMFTQYQVNNSGPLIYNGSHLDFDDQLINIGDTLVISYYSSDVAGNTEPPKNISLITQRQPLSTPTLLNSMTINRPMNAEISKISPNNISLKINNIPSSFGFSSDNLLNYEIIYQGNSVQKGIAGKINKEEINNNSVEKQFYLGTCSTGGICTPEIIPIGSTITLNLTGKLNGTEIEEITKSLVY